MPTLSDFLGDRKLFDKGTYAFNLSEVVHEDGYVRNKEYGTVQLKGDIDGRSVVIFRYLHPNCLSIIASELIALGLEPDEDADPSNGDWVASAYEKFAGQALKVNAKIRPARDGYEARNEFFINGLADGTSTGRV